MIEISILAKLTSQILYAICEWCKYNLFLSHCPRTLYNTWRTMDCTAQQLIELQPCKWIELYSYSRSLCNYFTSRFGPGGVPYKYSIKKLSMAAKKILHPTNRGLKKEVSETRLVDKSRFNKVRQVCGTWDRHRQPCHQALPQFLKAAI